MEAMQEMRKEHAEKKEEEARGAGDLVSGTSLVELVSTRTKSCHTCCNNPHATCFI